MKHIKIFSIILAIVLLFSVCTACHPTDRRLIYLCSAAGFLNLDIASAEFETVVRDAVPKGENWNGEVSQIEQFSINGKLCHTIINDKRFKKLPIKDKNYIKYKTDNSGNRHLIDDPITEGYYCIINRTNQEETLDTTTIATEINTAVNYTIVYCDPKNKKLYIYTFTN